jgi:predicted metalloprotease with PDZ domain
MLDDLLWIYEGLTEYYADVMTARCGLRTPEQYRENLAYEAGVLATRQGRTWRSLQDTADIASRLYGSSEHWSTRRRAVDFYNEGALIWLDADTLIRQKSGGKKSLDDFCRTFFGAGTGGGSLMGSKPKVVPYTADDVYNTLGTVVAHDWKAFFSERLHSLSPEPPLAGVTQGGWKLVYTAKPNKIFDARSSAGDRIDLRFSLGLVIDSKEETILDVVPGSPADKAGVGPNMKLLGVNGRKLDRDRLNDALTATPKTKGVELLLDNASYFITAKVAYDGGPRVPHLERVAKTPDILKNVLQPRAK